MHIVRYGCVTTAWPPAASSSSRLNDNLLGLLMTLCMRLRVRPDAAKQKRRRREKVAGDEEMDQGHCNISSRTVS
ncbi:hypothetical protein GWI33_004743 [Rhynchophorus ferrugineus]|uniref:Uncharacterized protein n=1 Tax=Rhynchophorus ferrugineus TaxID=354439 RepID=A0A834IPS5_RHYFE|nr:hypothetical protein GWI33_004743 [Rhynchophorus ferrugineus]